MRKTLTAIEERIDACSIMDTLGYRNSIVHPRCRDAVFLNIIYTTKRDRYRHCCTFLTLKTLISVPVQHSALRRSTKIDSFFSTQASARKKMSTFGKGDQIREIIVHQKMIQQFCHTHVVFVKKPKIGSHIRQKSSALINIKQAKWLNLMRTIIYNTKHSASFIRSIVMHGPVFLCQSKRAIYVSGKEQNKAVSNLDGLNLMYDSQVFCPATTAPAATGFFLECINIWDALEFEVNPLKGDRARKKKTLYLWFPDSFSG